MQTTQTNKKPHRKAFYKYI